MDWLDAKVSPLNCKPYSLGLVFFLWVFVSIRPAFATEEKWRSDVLLFAASDVHEKLANTSMDNAPGYEGEVALFAVAHKKRFHWLLESVVETDFSGENRAEIERFIFAFDASPQTRLELGRSHIPLGIWNQVNHHGSYLKTSTGSPGIVRWEDKGGPLPVHIAGVTVTTSRSVWQDSWLDIQLSLGAGPSFRQGQLHPLSITEPFSDTHKLALSSRMLIRSETNPRQSRALGLFANITEIPFERLDPVRGANLKVLGAFAFFEGYQWSLISSLFHVETTVNYWRMPSLSGRFDSGYLQTSYHVSSAWKIYGRIEGSRHTTSNAYLKYFPEFIRARKLLGLRYDFSEKQAIKVEWHKAVQQGSTQYDKIIIEWSAVIQ